MSTSGMISAFEQTQDLADRFDVRWRLRPGTITQEVSSTQVGVLLDGDTGITPCFPMISSAIPVDTRVYVIFVPPEGHYIAGFVNSSNTSVELIDAIETNVPGASQTTVGATELDLFRLAHLSVPVIAGQLYQVRGTLITGSTVAVNEFELRLRQTTALTGTVVGSDVMWARTITTAGEGTEFLIQWVPTTTIVDTFHLSLVRTFGTGTGSVFYNTQGSFFSRTRTVMERLGPASKQRIITV